MLTQKFTKGNTLHTAFTQKISAYSIETFLKPVRVLGVSCPTALLTRFTKWRSAFSAVADEGWGRKTSFAAFDQFRNVLMLSFHHSSVVHLRVMEKLFVCIKGTAPRHCKLN